MTIHLSAAESAEYRSNAEQIHADARALARKAGRRYVEVRSYTGGVVAVLEV